ncbi:hypothetical protein KJ591_00405 [Patescibacteria group bacterium]|nr:hypothetical protein [Patescibacteria group bacterium]MBU4022817.1 hypothetical protein [Patescibacteria group bacterium]MBU4162295.1 hypothetical protein [Patescibacteria group bacterium]
MNDQNEKVSPKHVFLHLFSISMLYVTTINILTLIFQFINQSIKDPLVYSIYSSINSAAYYSHNLVRSALASIIIVFPLFIWGSWYLNKIYLRIPQVRQMKTRKWLIYLTLFIVSLVIVGDFIRIVWGFLGGEITLRFILKAFAVFITSGCIFGYYLWDVRREAPSNRSKYFAWLASAVVLTLIVIGFFLTGSPKQERLMRFDYQRVSALQEVQYQIISYWQSKERLPQELQELEDPISGFMVPQDPQTGNLYEYTIKGENEFELCAEFNLPSDEKLDIAEPRMLSGSNFSKWSHPAGRFCFERTIDQELYPPFKKL